MSTIRITVGVQVWGFHNWPGAPERFVLLRYKHNHNFTIRVTLAVPDYNRGVAFEDLEQALRVQLIQLYPITSTGLYDFGSCSCELIALELAQKRYLGHGPIQVAVWEDSLHGATVIA